MRKRKMPNVILTCKTCNKDFEVKHSYANRKKFCSLECRKKYEIVSIKCQICGISYEVQRSQADKRVACSISCQQEWQSKNRTGGNHHNYKKKTKTCEICNMPFAVKNDVIKNGGGKYCSIKCKRKAWIEKYANNEEHKKLRLQGCVRWLSTAKTRKTKPEKMVEDFLVANGIPYIYQYNLSDKFSIDFVIEDKKIAIEVLGDYWHGNPNKYDCLSDRQIMQRKRDKARFAYLKKCGYNVFGIWENDIYNDITLALSNIVSELEAP